MTTSVLTYSKSRLTKAVYRDIKYCEPAFEGEVAWSKTKLTDIINRDNERAPEVRYARHHEPNVFYVTPSIFDEDRLMTIEKLSDVEDSDSPAQHEKEGTRVTFGVKITLWIEEHVYCQYARGGHGTSYQFTLPPHTREFKEVDEDDFFKHIDHVRTGATYVRGTEQVVVWKNYTIQGTFKQIGRAPDDISAHEYHKQGTVDYYCLYSKGYTAYTEFSSELKEYMYYDNLMHNLYFPTYIEYTLCGYPEITAYIVNGGILKPVDEEVMIVPGPVLPPPEVISLLDDDCVGTAVETRTNIPVDTSVDSDSDSVPVMRVSTSNWRKRKIIMEDSSDDE
jgi:hypothetical protein